MPQIFDEICRLVAEGRYLIGDHAWERLLERGIMEWQIIAGMTEAQLITERRVALAHLFADEDFSEEG